MNFKDIGLNEKIVTILHQMGYENPTPIQEKTIPLALAKKDVVGRSETGSGKTMAFALPIIQNIDTSIESVQSLIVCPTRELANQCATEILKVTSSLSGIKVCAVFGGTNMDRQIIALKKRPQIVVGTPGRLLDHMKRKTIKLNFLKTIVLDEADEMLDMGFREDIESILKSTPTDRQTLLFSATIPQEIKKIIKNYLHDEVLIEIGVENKAIDKTEQFYTCCKQQKKLDVLIHLIKTIIVGKTIVFANTKRMVDKIYEYLQQEHFSCSAIHGDMRQSARSRVMKDMKMGDNPILIATDVAARGIDIKNIEYIINYDIPVQQEYYIHRIGRTARAGESGKVVNIISNQTQLNNLKQIEKITQSKIVFLDSPFNEKFEETDILKNAKSKNYDKRHGTKSGYGNMNRKKTDYFKSFNKNYRKSYGKTENADENANKEFSFNKTSKKYSTFKNDRFNENTDVNEFEKKPRRDFNKFNNTEKSEFNHHYKKNYKSEGNYEKHYKNIEDGFTSAKSKFHKNERQDFPIKNDTVANKKREYSRDDKNRFGDKENNFFKKDYRKDNKKSFKKFGEKKKEFSLENNSTNSKKPYTIYNKNNKNKPYSVHKQNFKKDN